jgi:carbonic anhydrase/acetyltransferase-like protein (isoleucine patch superfamily)
MIINYKEFTPEIGERTFIAPSANVIGDVKVGADSSVWFGTIIRGDVHSIKIGSRTSIQDLSMVHVSQYTKSDKSDGYPTKIGNDVTVGHKVMLHGCTIGDACLIGMSATLLDGCEIGKESIVAAGSIVTQNKKIPPQSLIIGTPAKVLRKLSEKEIESIYKSAENYVNYKDSYL